jgi:hypothetical protein
MEGHLYYYLYHITIPSLPQKMERSRQRLIVYLIDCHFVSVLAFWVIRTLEYYVRTTDFFRFGIEFSAGGECCQSGIWTEPLLLNFSKGMRMCLFGSFYGDAGPSFLNTRSRGEQIGDFHFLT